MLRWKTKICYSVCTMNSMNIIIVLLIHLKFVYFCFEVCKQYIFMIWLTKMQISIGSLNKIFFLFTIYSNCIVRYNLLYYIIIISNFHDATQLFGVLHFGSVRRLLLIFMLRLNSSSHTRINVGAKAQFMALYSHDFLK